MLVSYEHRPRSGIQERYEGKVPARMRSATVEAEIMVMLIAVLNLLVALLELLLAFK